MRNSIFIAATGQNVGKTTTSLGLIAGLKNHFSSVGFIKPIGQDSVETEKKILVDKDVPLIKAYFHLEDDPQEMSPLLLPPHFTRDYLDGKIALSSLKETIIQAADTIRSKHPFTVIEGTGHMGVGSIIDLNNAQVASLLKTDLVLIASGGLGSSFDEIALNVTQCEKYKVPIRGVILNRVLEEKKEMITHYMQKALSRLGIPLLGTIPYTPFLSAPTMADFENLFKTRLLTPSKEPMHHFEQIRLIASSVEIFQGEIGVNQLLITPSNRKEIILATLRKYWDLKIAKQEKQFHIGLILTGKPEPTPQIIEEIRQAEIPMLYVPMSSFQVMKMIHSFTAKIREGDTVKIEEAIETVVKSIDFQKII